MLQYLRNSPDDWRVSRFDWPHDVFEIIPNAEFEVLRPLCVKLGIPIVDISDDRHDIDPPEKHHRRPLGNGILQYTGILRISSSQGVAVFINGMNGQSLLSVVSGTLRDREHKHPNRLGITELDRFLTEKKECIELEA